MAKPRIGPPPLLAALRRGLMRITPVWVQALTRIFHLGTFGNLLLTLSAAWTV